MTTVYPTSIDSYTNPTPTSPRTAPSVAGQMSDKNDAITAIETKLGVNGSGVNTTIDYKLSGVVTGDKAVSKTGAETLTNKTITNPTISAIINTGTLTLPAPIVSDTLLARNTVDTVTNKTMTGATNVLTASLLKSATTEVSVAAAAAPVVGYVLTATSTTTATWQSAFSGGSTSSTIPTAAFVAAGVGNTSITSNTTLAIGRIFIPLSITATKVSFYVTNPGGAFSGAYKIALFSDNGLTQIFNLTTATVSSAAMYTTTIGSTVISAGYYYIGMIPDGTVNYSPGFFNVGAGGLNAVSGVAGGIVLNGTLTVTAYTMPSTISPTAITPSTNGCTLSIRLDA